MQRKHFLLAALAAMSMFTACDKYDDGEIRDNLAAIDNRVTALEGKVTTLEGAMSALQTVVDRNYSITAFDKIDNGYKLTFTTGETLELLNGEKGDKGDTGAQGEKGDKGDKGDTGATGAQGEKGDKGDKGDTGATGAQGEKGDKGDKGDTGATGAQGEKGDKGDKGDTGATGAQGEKGDKGDKGDTGATGAQGEKGDKGDTGATGAQGEKGDKGDKGDTGATGAQGEKGDKGDTGATGATGPQGPAGPAGAAGDSFFKSVTQNGDFIVIVMNDASNTTYTIPCAMITIGTDPTANYIGVEANKSKDIVINIPSSVKVASVTATVIQGAGSSTYTRATDITEWKTAIAYDDTNDAWKVTVDVPKDFTGAALLHVIVAKADGTTYTASKALKLKNPYLLDGSFSVSSSTKVKFTKSNLYWNGSAWKFETNPTDYPTTRETTHVGHFFWTKDKDKSYAASYDDGTNDKTDKFFADGNDGRTLTVDGVSGLYVLSEAEWTYLLQTRTNAPSLFKYGVTVNGKDNCLVIAPDGFTGTIETSYTLDGLDAAGLVCLPAAGTFNGSSVYFAGSCGYCWSSSALSASLASLARYLFFNSGEADVDSESHRHYGCSLRAVLAE